jgi:hypothetical protein
LVVPFGPTHLTSLFLGHARCASDTQGSSFWSLASSLPSSSFLVLMCHTAYK